MSLPCVEQSGSVERHGLRDKARPDH